VSLACSLFACGEQAPPSNPGGAAGAGGGGTSGGAAGSAGAVSGQAGSSGGGSAGTFGGASAQAGGSGGSGQGGGAFSGGAAGAGFAIGGAAGAGAGGVAGAGGAAGAAGTAGGGGAVGGSAGAINYGPGTIALSGLAIERNPNMTISCFVSWTTPEAATSEVHFGETDYEFRVRDEALVTEHRVLVIGMHPETTYKIKAVSGNAQGAGSAEGTFMAGELPSSFPTAMLTKSVPDKSHAGWTLTNIQPSSLSLPAGVVMYDEAGVAVWYYLHGPAGDARGDVSTQLLPEGVLVGPTSGVPARLVDLSGAVKWEGPAQSQQQLMTHFVVRRGENYVLNRELDKSVMNGSTRIDGQRLEEVTPDNDVVWSWNLFDHVEPAGTEEELCHANHLHVDEPAGTLYYNCRWVGLFKIERTSGAILWYMAGTHRDVLGAGDFTFDPPASQFSDAHEPEFTPEGTLLLYDNGGFSFSGGAGLHSRVLEYELDEATMTARRVFEFPGDLAVDDWYKNGWYTPYWGDTDRLPNRNLLITAGVRSTSASTRIFEVTPQGEVVWELTLPSNYGSYKAERLSPPPLVERLP
jgi:hypothetical protein